MRKMDLRLYIVLVALFSFLLHATGVLLIIGAGIYLFKFIMGV